ncbi:hypothetical protein KAR91_67010 [Candidatus Pacearchaeota archaeon]|nr:hypothetical protein [Candidatus Pacearchaeota archaeon]
MNNNNVNGRQLDILSTELTAALEKVDEISAERDMYKGHLKSLLKALGDDSADRIIADYRVPDVTLEEVAFVLKNNVIG